MRFCPYALSGGEKVEQHKAWQDWLGRAAMSATVEPPGATSRTAISATESLPRLGPLALSPLIPPRWTEAPDRRLFNAFPYWGPWHCLPMFVLILPR